MTLTGRLAQPPPPPPPLRDTNPTLPHPVPTGEEALSLIKQAVAMK